MNYVIIGNSAAAVGAVEGIRSVDTAGDITLIAAEPHFTYSRPLISYLLAGRTDEQRMRYRPVDFYERHRVKTRLGETVTAIDAAAKVVHIGEEAVPYDRLLVATGSHPFIPPLAGLDTVPHAFTFGSLDDAHALESALFPTARVLILGAGLIGLKCAEGIAERVGSLTVVDMAPRILPSILDEDGAALLQAYLEQKGLCFRLENSVASLDGQTAVLRSGDTLEFDILVIAVGVRPNTELVQKAGGAVQRGIVTDDCCRTTLPDVYAAGDCAESHDITTDSDRVLALLPNAYAQGECAGIQMAGGDKRYENAIPMNAIGFFGKHLLTAGSYDGESHVVAKENGVYKRLITRDNRLVGYILLGDIERAGIYTALIRNRTPLDTLDFELIMEKPQLLAFSRAERQRQLGGMNT